MKTLLKKIDKKELYVLLLLVILSLPSIFSFLHAGFPKTDDGDWMIIRFSAFYEALRDGQFPVRWLPRLNHGFGYPVANFLYPGFMYLGVPFKAIGFSFVETIKLLFAVSLVSSVAFSYLWLRTHFTRVASIAGSLVYLYLPYHLYDVTVRGSLGEVLALAVIPFVLWSLEKRYLFVSVIGIGLLILSHNTIALLSLPLIFIYGTLLYKKEEFRNLFVFFLLGVGSAAFFWLPALADLSATVFSQTVVSHPSEYFATLSQIGVVSLILILSGVILLLYKKEQRKNKLYLFWFIILVLSLFMSSGLSKVLWEILPVQFVQFPFRFLSLTLLAGAAVTAYLVKVFKIHIGFVIAFIALLFITNQYYQPKSYDVFEEGYYTTNQATTTVQDEYMPIAVKRAPSQQAESLMSLSYGFLDTQKRDGVVYTGTVRTLDAETLTVSQLYFPGWIAYINGFKTPVAAQKETGRIVVPLPPGNHTVIIRFEETPIRLFADVVSGLSIIISGILILVMKKRRKANA